MSDRQTPSVGERRLEEARAKRAAEMPGRVEVMAALVSAAVAMPSPPTPQTEDDEYTPTPEDIEAGTDAWAEAHMSDLRSSEATSESIATENYTEAWCPKHASYACGEPCPNEAKPATPVDGASREVYVHIATLLRAESERAVEAARTYRDIPGLEKGTAKLMHSRGLGLDDAAVFVESLANCPSHGHGNHTDNAISGRCSGLRERAPLTHVAVKDEHGLVWSLPRPYRHHHVLKVMHEHGAKQDKAEPPDRQGFLDAHGHYLTRKQALVNATRHNQLKGGKTIASILTSEDLW